MEQGGKAMWKGPEFINGLSEYLSHNLEKIGPTLQVFCPQDRAFHILGSHQSKKTFNLAMCEGPQPFAKTLLSSPSPVSHVALSSQKHN